MPGDWKPSGRYKHFQPYILAFAAAKKWESYAGEMSNSSKHPTEKSI